MIPKQMKCININDVIGLTLFKEYTITGINNCGEVGGYGLNNDNGEFYWYSSNRFEDTEKLPLKP